MFQYSGQNSSSEYSYSITFQTQDIARAVEQNLGSWNAKFGKGYKIEIYSANNECLYSTDISTRGQLSYEPILVRIDIPRGEQGVNKSGLPPFNQAKAVYRNLYLRGYVGPIGNGYRIIGWRVIEE